MKIQITLRIERRRPQVDEVWPEGGNYAETERARENRIHELNNDERPEGPYGRFSNR